MKSFTLRISDKLDTQLNSLANEQELTKSQLIRAILREFIEERKTDKEGEINVTQN